MEQKQISHCSIDIWRCMDPGSHGMPAKRRLSAECQEILVQSQEAFPPVPLLRGQACDLAALMKAVWLAYLDQHPDAEPGTPEHAAEAAAAAAALASAPAGTPRSLFLPGGFTHTDSGKRRLVYWKITLDARVVSDDGELHTEVMIVLLEAGAIDDCQMPSQHFS
eukprot:3932010-Rhodomonas_salina.1